MEKSPDRTSDRLLLALKMQGPQSAAELAVQMGTSSENVRQLLQKLSDEALVQAQSVSQGRGRPRQIWHLTEAAQARFPDTHPELTRSLISSLRSVFGQEALDRLIAARSDETEAGYRAALAGAGDLAERLGRLAAQRTREGYMAEWAEAPDGDGYVLSENHCPICVAAAECQGFCSAELRVFRAVLGADCSVEREEHLLSGARRCSYRVRPAG
ncbi:helix-turn-helix transcriptional regulator [Paracoccus aminophilus]|uniref:helix-turn-helix transcriptional regulator n=1 Tax=Paracoccus aminophilus TaxID=34003 RepID=UPI0005A2C58C|nr:metalloregulator ArsR/SmtB family transcription factor [Paracoccus aminophilus]